MRQEEHDEIVKELEAKHEKTVKDLEAKVKLQEGLLKEKDAEIEKLDKSVRTLEGQLEELGAEPEKDSTKPVPYLGLGTKVSFEGKKYPYGTAKEELPKEAQKKFAQYFVTLEK